MAPEPRAGGRPAPTLALLSWTSFDWAFQPFFTLVSTFVFAPYFATQVVGDAVRGQALWGYSQSAAGLIIALLSPVLGAIADVAGPRKPWILVLAAMTFAGSAVLWWAVPGADGPTLAVILGALVVATVGAEFAIVFNNAMLPSLVPPDRIGMLSAVGWAIGYLGGLVSLGLVLGFLVLPATPAFGLDKAAFEAERLTGPLTALWLALFLAPMFLFVPDLPRRRLSVGAAVTGGLAQLAQSARQLRRYRNVVRYLLAHMAYIDGLNATFVFGGIYAATTFGWDTRTLGVFGILLIVLSTAGAFAGGWIERWWGARRTVAVALVTIALAVLGIVSLGPDSILFGLPVAPPAAGRALFDSDGERTFIAFAVLLGIAGGPAQASSRSLMAQLAPPHMVTEAFGLYALAGKATAFVAPVLVGLATAASGSQRLGLSVLLGFFAVGLVLLAGVRAPVSDGSGARR